MFCYDCIAPYCVVCLPKVNASMVVILAKIYTGVKVHDVITNDVKWLQNIIVAMCD